MSDGIEIRGGAGEFEAAVIAVVLDRISEDERVAREGRPKSESGLSAWMRAINPEEPEVPLEMTDLF